MEVLNNVMIGVKYNEGKILNLRVYPMMFPDVLATILTQVYRWLSSDDEQTGFNPETYDAYVETFGRYDAKVLDSLLTIDHTLMSFAPASVPFESLEKGTKLTKDNFAPTNLSAAIFFEKTDEGVKIYMSSDMGGSISNVLKENGCEPLQMDTENNKDVEYWERLETNVRMMDNVIQVLLPEDLYEREEMERYSVSTGEVKELILTD